MSYKSKKIGITEVVLRDGHQSLLATRLQMSDISNICHQLDNIGYWSIECWGGATFDSCIRYLNEDPWQRLKNLKKLMPKTPLQMLIRGQNLLGYRHYSDDVVDRFIEKSAENGINIFRIFDALNDGRNIKRCINATKAVHQHAQATLCYTTSPVHDIDYWVNKAIEFAEMGADSIAIKDMAGILTPYMAEELVYKLKQEVDIELHLHAHATAGLSDMTIIKAIEAGIDRVDTSISSMSGTYGHTATESVVASLNGTKFDTGLNLESLEKVSKYFASVRDKYKQFEGKLKGTDSRILISQVPGGMLTNMENQLKEQNALDRMEEVLDEIPRVRKDLGYIPLVTPTSQIVGTQAVLNILTNSRYSTLTNETKAILKGEYGKTPVDIEPSFRNKYIEENQIITCRPADLLKPEWDEMSQKAFNMLKETNSNIEVINDEDILTYVLFPNIAQQFFNKRNQGPIEIINNIELSDVSDRKIMNKIYEVKINNTIHIVEVKDADILDVVSNQPLENTGNNQNNETINSPLAGNIWKVLVNEGQSIIEGDVLIILEAMKMETEIRSPVSGVVSKLFVKEASAVKVGDLLIEVGV